MRKGFVKRYKGCAIHDAGECYIITDKHGTNIHETKCGIPIIEAWIEENTTNGKLNVNIQE